MEFNIIKGLQTFAFKNFVTDTMGIITSRQLPKLVKEWKQKGYVFLDSIDYNIVIIEKDENLRKFANVLVDKWVEL